MSIRAELAAAIKPYLPADWTLQDYTDDPDVQTTPLVMLSITAVRPGDMFGALTADVSMYVLIPSRDDAERDEDAIEDALLPSISALYSAAAVRTIEARRALFPPSFPCWEVSLTISFTLEKEV